MSKEKIITRKHLARQERERIQTRNIMLVSAAVILLVVGLLGYGIVNETYLIPNRPVATVNGEKISMAEFQMQSRYTRQNIISQYIQMYQFAQMFGSDPTYQDYFNQQLVQLAMQLEPITVGQAVVDSLIEDRLIRAEAEQRGITATAEEVDVALAEAFGYFPNGTPTSAPTFAAQATSTLSATQLALVPPTSTPTLVPTEVITQTATPTIVLPTATPGEPTLTPTPYTEEAYKQEFADVVSQMDESIQVSEKNLRRIYESILLRNRLTEVITADTPTATEQVWARHILVTGEITATMVLAKLASGTDFAELAAEYSTDTGSAQSGGDLGWFGKGVMIEAFETVAFDLEVGEISNPVESSFGWHIIQVLGHENRPLSETEYQNLREQTFQTWLDAQREAADIVIDESWVNSVPTEPTIPPEYAVTSAN